MCYEDYQRRIEIPGHRVPVMRYFTDLPREHMDRQIVSNRCAGALNIPGFPVSMTPRVPDGKFPMNGIWTMSRLHGSTNVPTSAPALKGVR